MDLDFVLILLVCYTNINGAKLERLNVALNKTVTASSVYTIGDRWSSIENIVDGDLRRNGHTCECCFATELNELAWITVDLHKEYLIDLVTIYGRTDDTPSQQNLLGLQLYFVKSTEIQDEAKFTATGEGFLNFVNASLEEDVITRYVTARLPGKKVFAVCELEVYDKVCSPGTYGINCFQLCGQCSDGEVCDHVNGHCQLCSPGFQGMQCKQACSPGTFGQNCSSLCGECYNRKPCDRITGACEQCAAGYKGTDCLSACDDGYYGSGCPSNCGHCYDDRPCNKVDGTCDRCAPGYYGTHCIKECEPGIYGENCTSVCGPCKHYQPCNHISGVCVNGCAAGRYGDLCAKECVSNTFGEDCSQQCHCRDDKTCDSFTGTCDDGACADGYSGPTCQQIRREGDDEISDSATSGIFQPAFIGVSVVLGCVIIAYVATVVYFVRKRKPEPSMQTTAPKMDDEHQYDDLHVDENQL